MIGLTNILLSIVILLLILLNITNIWNFVKYWKSRDRYKKQRFTKYINGFLSIILFFVSICWFLNLLSYSYFIGIISVYITSIAYIQLVKNIKKKYDLPKNNQRGYISEYQFLGYLIFFSLVLFLFIFSFSVFYVQQIPLGNFLDGYFTKETKINNLVIERVYPLNYSDAFFYSGYTFFSLDYGNFKAKGLLKMITLLELFTAQTAVIIFISILAGYALQKLRLNK